MNHARRATAPLFPGSSTDSDEGGIWSRNLTAPESKVALAS
jgi:hypothetical protein